MLQKIKSHIRVTYPSSVGNKVMEVVLLFFMVASLFFNTQTVPRVYSNVFFGLLAILWGINYIRFYKNTGIGFLKCCSLQLIVCGLLGALLGSLWNVFLPQSIVKTDIITVVLLMVVIGINVFCYQDKRTVYYVTFLLFPCCILSADFFLIVGFLSAFLLLIAIFNGTLVFEHQRMDDDEYFGNSNH